MVVYNDCLYVFGGVDKGQKRFNDLFIFNFHNRTWEQLKTSGNIPSPRSFHRMVLYKNNLFVIGGFDGARLNDLFILPLLKSTNNDSFNSSFHDYHPKSVSSIYKTLPHTHMSIVKLMK